MFELNLAEVFLYLIIGNTIINILIGILNKDFRTGNHINQLLELKGMWLIIEVLTPCFLFPRVIKSIVKNEKEQAKEEKLKSEIRTKNLNNKNRRR